MPSATRRRDAIALRFGRSPLDSTPRYRFGGRKNINAPSSACAEAAYRLRRIPRRGPIMLTDRYELPLSTASSAARDAYLQGCEAKLTMYPGAIEAFDCAIAADPGFALAHAARAHVLLERGDAAGARASMAATDSLAAGLSGREVSHIAFFGLLVAGGAPTPPFPLVSPPAH